MITKETGMNERKTRVVRRKKERKRNCNKENLFKEGKK